MRNESTSHKDPLVQNFAEDTNETRSRSRAALLEALEQPVDDPMWEPLEDTAKIIRLPDSY